LELLENFAKLLPVNKFLVKESLQKIIYYKKAGNYYLLKGSGLE